MKYVEMTAATRRFSEKSEALIARLNLEETLQNVINSEPIQKMVEEEFERCVVLLKKSAIFAPDEVKKAAEKNAETFATKKENYALDFNSNFKIMLGMSPCVYLSENVKEDEIIKQFVMELFQKPKIYELAQKTLKYQTNGVMYNFFVASAMDNDPKNMTLELVLAMEIIDSNSEEIKLPSTVSFF